MARATLTERVEVLEHNVRDLAALPERIGAIERELREFRVDVDAEFGKVDARFGKVDAEFGKVHAEFGKVQDEFGKVGAEFALVRAEIREGDEETRRYMRVLYEDLVERIKIMGEGIDELRSRS